MIVDVHTHAFPDTLAARAIAAIEGHGGSGARHVLDGTVADLLRSMDRAGITHAVVLNIATRPEQYESILRFCEAIRNRHAPRLIPFPSVHPADPDLRKRLERIQQEGFLGIKLHTHYQDFVFDEDRLMPLYEAVEELGLILEAHTGHDIAFPRDGRCTPERIVRVLDRFPRLRFIASHFGAWLAFDEVRRWFLGRPIHLEISMSLPHIPPLEAKTFIEAHGPQYVFFGSDSPWADQAQTLADLRGLGLSPEALRLIEGENARRFFNL